MLRQCQVNYFRGADTANYSGWSLIAMMAGLIMEPVEGETRPKTSTAVSTKWKAVDEEAEMDDSGLWE
jgi:hypothetical protein